MHLGLIETATGADICQIELRGGREMKAGDLKVRMAKAMLLEEPKVWSAMRNLREQGLLTTGARGVNAPDMTYLDAARVLLAHIVKSKPGRAAPALVRDFGSLEWANRAFPLKDDPFTLNELVPDAPADTFEQALAALIRVFGEHRQSPWFKNRGSGHRNPLCQIRVFEEDRYAEIDMAGALYHFDAGTVPLSKWTPQHDERERLGRQCLAFVNQEVVAMIADGFREGE